MSNDWINEVPKKRNSSSFFFSCSWSDVCLFLFLLFFSALALLSKRAPCIKFSCWQCAQQGWKFRASFLKVTNTYVPWLYRASSRMIQEELLMNDKQNCRNVLLRYHENGRILWLHPESCSAKLVLPCSTLSKVSRQCLAHRLYLNGHTTGFYSRSREVR